MQQKPRNDRTHDTPSRLIAKKSLGQNFLHDPGIIRRIADSLNLASDDWVLEIGCGRGALTRALAGRVQQFIGVELDSVLFQKLYESFAGPATLFLNQDVLRLDLTQLLRRLSPKHEKLKIVGNLPYYISSPILGWLGRQSEVIRSATIMLQAEVADRLLAMPASKTYGVLTVMTAYQFDCERLFDIRPGAFRPVPKVRSALVRLRPKPKKSLELGREEAFFDFVKRCFSKRRKTLRNCLKGAVEPESLESALLQLGHSTNARAEALSLNDLLRLFRELK
jgi:16S rRNA (adenine1518-N6/adenine1519-N6)-dimethyltransferase